MHAFAVDAYESPGTYRELPVPEVDTHEVLIRVHAAGVNPYDVTVLAGGYKDRPPASFPLIPGVDVAGTIERIGTAVTGFAVGDEVYGRVTKPALSPIAAKPRSIGFEQAALVSVNQVQLRQGDTVLVVGATGGVGGYAAQIAGHRGAHVIGTADPASKEYVKGLGAAEVIDYRDQDVAAALPAPTTRH